MGANSKIQSSNNKGIIGFLKEIRLELKRMTWAPKKDVKKAAITVMTFCIIFMVLVGAFDYIFSSLFKFIFSL